MSLQSHQFGSKSTNKQQVEYNGFNSSQCNTLCAETRYCHSRFKLSGRSHPVNLEG